MESKLNKIKWRQISRNPISECKKNQINSKIIVSLFRFYLFGCLTVTTSGDFTSTQAQEGTFFVGDNSHDSNWVYQMQNSCKLI